jgi:N4-(beta-N-acetylglucosaminyl)-L-asparaginase
MPMSPKVNRRDFVLSSAAAVVAAASTGAGRAEAQAAPQAPTMMVKKTVPPVVIASNNGNTYKNGGDITGVAKAFRMMTEGADVLDALIAGVNLCELDPADTSVGYGGMPNADGVVQLDSSCMHGPKKRAGAVACIEGVRTPSLVAKAVMETTDHHLLVGKGAQEFARNMGFTIEADLNTERSRGLWLEWKRRVDSEHYLDPIKRSEAGFQAGLQMVRDGLIEADHYFGTINCDGINPKGDICGVTTTSGLAWKIPGRVGDSPILGAGLYVDNAVGAAGSTGRGEANIYNLSSFGGEAAPRFERAAPVPADLLRAEREGRVRRRVLLPVEVCGVHGERAAVGRYRTAVSGAARARIGRPGRARRGPHFRTPRP